MSAISTRGVYGLAAMHVLSHAPRSRAMQIKEIAAMTQVSHAYLEQLLSALRKGGLLSSTRGANGGYKLARSANDITVLEIIETLEGTLCKIEGNVGASVVLEYFWLDVYEKVKKLFSLKLSELDQSFQPLHYDI